MVILANAWNNKLHGAGASTACLINYINVPIKVRRDDDLLYFEAFHCSGELEHLQKTEVICKNLMRGC